MATEVSPMVNRASGTSQMLVTRDLLGGLSNVRKSKEMDQQKNLEVYRGWDSAPLHDFKPAAGTTQTQMAQRCNSPDSPLSSTSFNVHSEKHDRYRYSTNNPTLKSLLEETTCSLELKLNPSTNNYYYPSQSVCTLEKVKSALQKLETSKKRPLSPSLSLSSPNNNVKQLENGGEPEDMEMKKMRGGLISNNTGLMFAAGCPGCLLYVITSRSDPKCPRCNSIVPSSDPLAAKKPRVDLNNASFYSWRL